MPVSRIAQLLAVSALLVAAGAEAAHAQSLGDRLKKKAQDAARRKIEERVREKTGCAPGATCPAEPPGAEGGSATAGKAGEGAWVNYDFKPGERTLFADDFTRDVVGNFPRRLELVAGNMEVAELDGQLFLRGTSNPSTFEIRLPETLPERFTLEIDLKLGLLNMHENTIHFGSSNDYVSIKGWNTADWGGVEAGLVKRSGEKSTMKLQERTLATGVTPLRVLADGNYVKVYVGSTRVANVPNANIGRSTAIRLNLACTTPGDQWGNECFVGGIRVMAGGRKLYDVLTEKGRAATQGIYFDTGSDRIRPESTPTLKEIGNMLKEHGDLKLTIEGHSDDVGAAQANQDLSRARAAAVKKYLVEKHGIAENRLASTGFGDKRPLAPNTTPEGRQQNRRVELVKM